MATQSYFEFSYQAGFAPFGVGRHRVEKKLIVSFPSNTGLRDLDNDSAQKRPELLRTLCSGNADILFVRPVFRGFKGEAYINDDYRALIGLVHCLRKANSIDHVIALGYCFGCGAAFWLGQRGAVDEVVLLAPSLSLPSTLRMIDDPQWVRAFSQHCDGLPLPRMGAFPADVPMKIIYGSEHKSSGFRDKEIAAFLARLAPHAKVEEVSGAEHQVPQFWRRERQLPKALHDILSVRLAVPERIPDPAQIE